MYLWNSSDIGALAAYTAIALVQDEITGEVREVFDAGDLGEKEIVGPDDDGTEVIVGSPFQFNPDNIDEWKKIL